MTLEDSMREIVACFSTGDISRVDALIAPGYVDHQGLDGAELRGPDGFRRVVDVARSGFATLEVSVEDLFVARDRAAARLRWRGVRRTGEHHVRETIEIVRFADGSAVEHWGAHS